MRRKLRLSRPPRSSHAKVCPSANPLESVLRNTSTIGRRGLLNLGQTCFLNVVLQSFIHNPLLRNYFLGDLHNCRLCKHTDCACCEMDQLFTEVKTHPHHMRSIFDLPAIRYTLPQQHHLVQRRSSPRCGRSQQKYRGMLNKMPTSFLSPR